MISEFMRKLVGLTYFRCLVGHDWKYWGVQDRYCPRCGREEVCDLVTGTWREIW
jgi:hypothetical protein